MRCMNLGTYWMTDNFPLVTVNILSFNRKDELRNTLSKVYEQDYKNLEVIVVDNASSDGSPEMVEKEFPDVILIRLPNNIGIAGWNEGFKIAKGEYVLVLDDDAYPNSNSLSLAINKFVAKSNIGAIAFNVIDKNTGSMFWAGSWLPKINIKATNWPVFVGCAVLFNRIVIKENAFFPNNIVLYQHELSVSAKIYNENFVIYYDKEITAVHNCKHVKIYNPLIDKLVFQNNLIFILEFLPRLIFEFYLVQALLFYFSRSIKRGWFKDYFLIISNSIRSSKISYTPKIKYRYFFYLRKLHLFNFSLFSKLKCRLSI